MVVQSARSSAKEKMVTEVMKEDYPAYRGPSQETVEDILGGVRSACTYIGARRLKDMPKCASFVTVHNNINKVYERYTVK